MGLSVPEEQTSDSRPNFVPKTISEFLKELSMIGNGSEKVSKLDDFVHRLQEEMRKIEAFKRELPLCMVLLNEAICTLLKETVKCKGPNVEPVFEELSLLKRDSVEKVQEVKEKDNRDKKNWLSSVQLWNIDDPTEKNGENDYVFDKPFGSCKSRDGESEFMPFKGKEDGEEFPVHELSLCTREIRNSGDDLGSSGLKMSYTPTMTVIQSALTTGPQQQTGRKKRRCWSGELHRQFVEVLNQLGGSEVATPKHIRELMKVDGLTNDEVKSHLQKYRLHTRRALVNRTPLNLWEDNSSKDCSSHSGSPQSPFRSLGTGGGTSTTGGDSMDDVNDEKSENGTRKYHMTKSMEDDA